MFIDQGKNGLMKMLRSAKETKSVMYGVRKTKNCCPSDVQRGTRRKWFSSAVSN